MARWFAHRLPQRGIPSVSLRRLLPEAQFVGCPDWEVSGCSDDHRRLDPGQLFVAVRDPRYDGQAFVRQALERGAAGVIVERPCPEAGRLQVVVTDARAAHARLCQALAGDPSRRLRAVAVAGTFGKTVTSLFVRSILEAAGLRCGLVGASGWSDGTATRPLGAGIGPDPRTATRAAAPARQTADAWPGGAAGLASILGHMVEGHCAAGVIEVSPHALLARCFEGVSFQAAVVTDLGVPYGLPAETAPRDRKATATLVRQVAPGGAVIVNADDPHAELLGGLNLDARRVSFGMRHPTTADVSARVERVTAAGSRLRLHGFGPTASVELKLLGPRQIGHALAAAALAWALKIDVQAVKAGLEAVERVPGQLEAVDEGQNFEVRVDAAATADDLHQALRALRSVVAGRVHCLLSAQGLVETPARRALAEAAETDADQVVLTLGSPRSERPEAALGDVLGGFRKPARVRVEPDRARAIGLALSGARAGDAVLLSGQGRNAYQILADRVVPLDDFAVARRWLRDRDGDRTTIRQRSA